MEMPEQRKHAFWVPPDTLFYEDLVDLVGWADSVGYLVLQVTWPCAMKSIVDDIQYFELYPEAYWKPMKFIEQ